MRVKWFICVLTAGLNFLSAETMETAIVTGQENVRIASVFSAKEAQNKNYGGRLIISRANVAYQGLLYFNLDSLPEKPVKDAVILFYSEKQYFDNPAAIDVYPLEQNFDDKICTYNMATAETPWKKETLDHSRVLASVEIGAKETGCWKAARGARLTAQINAWLKNPAQNHGLRMVASNKYKGQTMKFLGDLTKPEFLPKLVVSYDQPIDVTEFGVVTEDMARRRSWKSRFLFLQKQAQGAFPADFTAALSLLDAQGAFTWKDELKMEHLWSDLWFKLVRRKFPLPATLAVWEISPWERLARGQLPGRPAAGWNVAILKDEVYEFALGITNIGDREDLYQVEVDGLPGEAVECYISMWVQGKRANEEERPDIEGMHWVDDVLLKLADDKCFSLKSGETSRLWLIVDGKRMSPGKYPFSVKLHLKSGEKQAVDGEIFVSQTALKMPEKLHVTSYAYLNRASTAGLQKSALMDILAHGDNTHVVNLVPRRDAASDRYDYSNLSEYLKLLKSSTPKMILFFWNAPAGPAVTPLENWGSPEWRENLRKAVLGWIEACEKAGFSKKQFAMYPVDEVYAYPWNKRNAYECLLDIVKVLKEIDPELLIFANPVSFCRQDIDYFRRLSPYIDIWAPIQSLYYAGTHTGHPKSYTETEKIAARNFFKEEQAKGKAIWTYQCSGPVKALDLNGYYRQFGWRAWLNGLTGLGIWSYNDIRGSSWSDEDKGDFSMIYEQRDAPAEFAQRINEPLLPSPRWQAWRRTLQDYALLEMAAAKVGRGKVEEIAEEVMANPFSSSVIEQMRKKLILIITENE